MRAVRRVLVDGQPVGLEVGAVVGRDRVVRGEGALEGLFLLRRVLAEGTPGASCTTRARACTAGRVNAKRARSLAPSRSPMANKQRTTEIRLSHVNQGSGLLYLAARLALLPTTAGRPTNLALKSSAFLNCPNSK